MIFIEVEFQLYLGLTKPRSTPGHTSIRICLEYIL